MQSNKTSLVSILILLILIVGAVFWFKKYYKNDGNFHEKVVESPVDLSKATKPEEKIPASFPKDIPLQLNEVIESTTLNYPERGVTVSIISFKTFRSNAELFSTYKVYFTNAGYVLQNSNTGEKLGTIFGDKDGNNLGVMIGLNVESDGQRIVKLVYTQNK